MWGGLWIARGGGVAFGGFAEWQLLSLAGYGRVKQAYNLKPCGA